MVIKNLATRKIWKFTDNDSIKEFFAKAPKDAVFIGHNLVSFDVPVLYRLLRVCLPLGCLVDTLILSYLYHPYLEGGHSLDNWGVRVGLKKVDVPDFNDVSVEILLERCERDVEITHRAWVYLCDVMSRIGYSEQSCEIEHWIRYIVDGQQRYGFYFDISGAESLYNDLRRRQQPVEEEIARLFPKRLVPIKEYVYRTKQSGEPYEYYNRHVEKYPKIVTQGDNYTVYDWEEFNLASPSQRVSRLLEIGWVPQKFTKPSKTHPNGQPQVDEDSLLEASERLSRPDLKAMSEWLVYFGRANMVRTWLNNVNRDDSCIHGTVFTCGALSRRCRHAEPNSANIPSNEAKFGVECRALWKARENRVLVGGDAKALQMRIFGHYLNNPEVSNLYLTGDPHQRNADASGFTRKAMKNCVPLTSKILTRRGWKFYNELHIGEDVLGYNEETKLKEWTKLRDIHRTIEEVIEFGHSRCKFQATANHRWFVRQRRMTGSKKSWINKRYNEEQVRLTNELNSESSLILNAPFNEEQDQVSKVSKSIIEGKYNIDWEQEVLNMSQSERRSFLHGFMIADGCYIGNRWHWSQNRGNLAEAALLASYLVHDGFINVNERDSHNTKMIQVILNKKSHCTLTTATYESIGVQEVWCPITDLGSWVMRQGDYITLTGNCFYAMIFGAFDKKLGKTATPNGTEEDGKKARDAIYKTAIGLERAVQEAKDEFKHNKGRLRCIDGGYVNCPSTHAAFNYKIQPDEAVLMKLVGRKVYQKGRKKGLDFHQVNFVHDEFQYDTAPKDAEELSKVFLESTIEAGEELGFRVPMEGSVKIGKGWDETH